MGTVDRSIAALVDLFRDVADVDDPASIPGLLAGVATRLLEADVVAVFLVSADGATELGHLAGCEAADLVESDEGLGHPVPPSAVVRTWPLASGGGLFGALVLGYPAEPKRSSDTLAQGLADVAAVGLDRAFRTRELLDTIRALEDSREQIAKTETLRRLGQMAAVVAHEVKNPLASIGGVIQVLHGRARAGEDRDVLGRVLDRLRELDTLVDELLQFARPRGPSVDAARLGPLLAEAVASFRQDPSAQGARVEFAGTDAVAVFDPGMIHRLVLNLLLNAVQAMDGAGVVTLGCAVRSGFVDVSVSDTGPGIPPELRERVFEPFYTTKARGSGLGLAIARQVAESHGGTLVADVAPSGGARFVLSLPSS